MTYFNKTESTIVDAAGNTNYIGPFGEQVTGSKYDDISVQFQYPYLNTDFDINPAASVATGDGVVTVPAPYAQISSAVTGTAVIQSKDSIRYRAGHSGFADFTASFTGTGTGYAGATDLTNGFALKIINGVASFGYFKAGVETGSSGVAGFDPEANWNGDLHPDDVDWTKLNIFRISFGYLGIANPTLWIKLDKWYVLHVIKTEGTLTSTHTDFPVFPVCMKVINGSTIRTGSWNGGTLGSDNSVGNRTFSYPEDFLVSGAGAAEGQVTLSGTNVGTLAIFRAKSTYQGKPNYVKSVLTSYSFQVDIPAGSSFGTVTFQIVGVGSLSGAATYNDIDTNNSVIEYDSVDGTGASVNATAGKVLLTQYLNYVGSNRGGSVSGLLSSAQQLGAHAYAGDTFAVIAKDNQGNNVTVRFSLNWKELF